MLVVREEVTPSHCDRAYGPIFGEGELRIGLDGTGYSMVGAYKCSFEGTSKIEPELQKTFMAGSADFQVESYELYQLKFQDESN